MRELPKSAFKCLCICPQRGSTVVNQFSRRLLPQIREMKTVSTLACGLVERPQGWGGRGESHLAHDGILAEPPSQRLVQVASPEVSGGS